MAYAAVVSLERTIVQFLNQDRFLDLPLEAKQHIISLQKHLLSLQASLEEFPQSAGSLEGRITELAYEAEDITEFIMHYFHPGRLSKLEEVTKEIASIVGEVTEIKDSYDVVQSGAHSSDLSSSSSAAATHKDAMVGFQDDLLAIKERLCGESTNLQIIPIYGMGGIGKTTLAKNVFDDPLTMYYFDIRVWVTVSQNYSAQGIISCLLDSMKEFNPQGQSDEEKVYKILMGKRYLVVMDDMWSGEAWDVVRSVFPDKRNGSRIILTTRLSNVASYPDPGSNIHEMQLMDADQSWELLKQKVFKDEDCPSELENIGKEIVTSCKGLPLAIVVIAGLVSTVSKNPASWQEIAENVKSVQTAEQGQIEEILSLSYTHLPQYLRPCFLYMGSFPEDHEIHASKLTKLWVAEGFLKHPNCSGSLEDEAEECLKDLIKRSLVLVTKRKSDGRIKSCSLHDLMRDLCIRKAYQSKFFLNVLDRHVEKKSFIESIRNQRRISVDSSSLRHLEINGGYTIHTVMCSQNDLVVDSSSLTHLANNGGSRNDLVELDLLECARLIRVLDAEPVDMKISGNYTYSFTGRLHTLFHLRYLAIRSCGIPELSPFQNLQTLILREEKRGNFVVARRWMQKIWSMPQLRHLHFYSVIFLYAPDTTPPLENLQTLSHLSHHSCTERVLKMIPNLKKLVIDCSGGDLHEDKACLNGLVHLHQLEILEIYAGRRAHLRPKYYSFALPRMLRKLTLRSLQLPWDKMIVVGSLPNLQVLKIREDNLTRQGGLKRDYTCAFTGETWETAQGGFLKLEFLLMERSYLEHWITEVSHFPCLKRLMLYYSRLREIPEGIAENPTLELIEVKDDVKGSLAQSAKRIEETRRDNGDDSLHVHINTHS